MSDSADHEDAAKLAAAIARVRLALEKGNPDPEAREGLEKELAIYMEMWREIDPLRSGQTSNQDTSGKALWPPGPATTGEALLAPPEIQEQVHYGDQDCAAYRNGNHYLKGEIHQHHGVRLFHNK